MVITLLIVPPLQYGMYVGPAMPRSEHSSRVLKFVCRLVLTILNGDDGRSDRLGVFLVKQIGLSRYTPHLGQHVATLAEASRALPTDTIVFPRYNSNT